MTDSDAPRFASKRGFWPSLILGSIVGYLIVFMEEFGPAFFMLGASLSVFAFVLIWFAYQSVKQDRITGNYCLLVGSTMALLGPVFGAIFLYATSGRPKVWRHFVAAAAGVALITLAAGYVLATVF